MIHPSLHGQLGWDEVRNEVQYIISWENNSRQSERATSLYGNFDVVSEGRTGSVAVQTDYVAANSEAIVAHANRKFSVEVPYQVTKDRDLYVAIAAGYGIDPPAGKMYVAGGVAYHVTALVLPEKREVTELLPGVVLNFNYSLDMDKSTLEICRRNATGAWEPATDGTKRIENGVATLKTTKLGTYALMMRNQVTLAEAVAAVEDVSSTLNQFISLVQSSNDADGGYVRNGNPVPQVVQAG